MKILFISNGDPFGVGGGAMGSRAFLHAFSEICNGNIDLVITKECRPDDKKIRIHKTYRVDSRSKWQKIIGLATGELHRYTSFVKELLDNNKTNYDLCVLNNSLLCYTLMPILKKHSIKTVVIHHNFEREYFRDNITNPFIRSLVVPLYIKSERRGYLNSDLNLFHSVDDLINCDKYYGKSKGPNKTLGVYEAEEQPNSIVKQPERKIKSLTYIITGSMNIPQGEDSVKYFLDELYRQIPQDETIIIAGQGPRKELIDICNSYKNIQIIPNPSDMNEILSQGDVYICPTRVGGGLKVRIMDGLKKGMPVLVHSCSIRGYDVFHEMPFFKEFHDSDSFKKGLDEIRFSLMNNEYSKEDIINKYNDYFSFDAGLNRITTFLNEAHLL